jgi:recombinational DNA repair protein (RecF pathway)
VEKTTREGDANEKIWKLLVWACEHIFAAEKYSQKIFVLNVFIIKLLTHIGYEIRSDQCGNCGEEFESGAKYDFSRNNFYCGKCARSGRPLPFSAIKIINATKKPNAICARLTTGEICGLFDFLGDYLIFYIERKFNSLETLRRLG